MSGELAWVVNPHTNAKEFYKNHRYAMFSGRLR